MILATHDQSTVADTVNTEIKIRLKQLVRMHALTTELVAESNSQRRERLGFLMDERQRLLNCMKKQDRKIAKVLDTVRTSGQTYPEFSQALAAIEQLARQINELEQQAGSLLVSQRNTIEAEMRAHRKSKQTVNAYAHEAKSRINPRLDTQL